MGTKSQKTMFLLCGIDMSRATNPVHRSRKFVFTFGAKRVFPENGKDLDVFKGALSEKCAAHFAYFRGNSDGYEKSLKNHRF